MGMAEDTTREITSLDTDTKLKILKKSRALLNRPHVWIQGHLNRTRVVNDKQIQQYCLVGALEHVAFDELNIAFDNIGPIGDEVSILSLVELEKDEDGEYYTEIESWNDADGRKKKDVIGLIDKRIKELSNG